MFSLLKLAAYLRDYKKECILGPFFKFTEVIFELLLPTIMALIINEGIAQGDVPRILRLGGLMVLMAFCGYGSALICQRFAAKASQGFGTVLRNDLFRHILALSYTQIDRFGAATLTNRITNDVNQLQLWVAMMIRLVSRAPFLCIGSIIMSFFLDIRLALILLCATPVLAVMIYIITSKAAPLYRAYQKGLDRLGDILHENLAGVRVIRAFDKTKRETKRFRAANDELTAKGLDIARISSFFGPLTSLIINIMILLLLWVGGIHINAGGMSQGEIIAFINYVNQILISLLVLSNLVILLTKSMASAARINELLACEPETAGQSGALVTSPSAPAIVFQDVDFHYHASGEPALKQINAVIERGETIGIIGSTGAGKTTFVNLIARFYETDDGHIYVDGVDVKQYALRDLRRKIGIVSQQAQVFSGTVADNIRWGKENATEEEIRTSACTAQADEFIRTLPQGYDTEILRGGSNLSGGQRQRLTIARALIAKPEILILDDASSALDFITDAALRRAIRRQSPGQTVLIISQRVGVVRETDRILVFEDGGIVGSGSHEELYRGCTAYRDICHSQLTEEEIQE